MRDFLLRFDEQSDGCEKSTAKFLRRSPTRERLVGHLTRQSFYRKQPRSDRRDDEHEFCMGDAGGDLTPAVTQSHFDRSKVIWLFHDHLSDWASSHPQRAPAAGGGWSAERLPRSGG